MRESSQHGFSNTRFGPPAGYQELQCFWYQLQWWKPGGGEGYSRVASGETLQWHQGFFAPLQSHSLLKDILDPPPPPSLYPAYKVKSLNSPMPPLFPVRILRMELEDVQDLSGLAALRTARMASCTLHQRKG